MKRFFTVLVAAIFVFGFAAAALAVSAEIPSETQSVVAKGATQITLGGNIRVRGELRETDGSSDTSTKAAYDQRVRLSTEAKTDNVTGYVMLETAAASDVYTWGRSSNATGGYTFGNGKPLALSINEAWLQYKVGTCGVKVGHMPLALGNKLFFDHTKFGDDAIVVFGDPAPGVHVGVLTAKLEEGANNTSDQDGYGALVTYKGEGFNLGGDVTYVDVNGGSTFAAPPASVMNIGLRGDATVGPAMIKADVEVQTGTLSKDVVGAEMDHSAYAALLGASGKMGDVSLGAELGYGTGQDTSADSTAFITSLGTDKHMSYVYDYRVAGACGQFAGICGTTYLKGSVSSPLMDKVTGALDVLYLMASEDVALLGATTADTALGIEVDAKVTYKVAGNLMYWVEGGYLAPGDAYGTDVDGMYAVRHGVELSF